MFLHYYIDTHATAKGAYEVHHQSCSRMPQLIQCHYLGMFESSEQAVAMAKVVHKDAAICKRCMNIHTKQAVRIRHRT